MAPCGIFWGFSHPGSPTNWFQIFVSWSYPFPAGSNWPTTGGVAKIWINFWSYETTSNFDLRKSCLKGIRSPPPTGKYHVKITNAKKVTVSVLYWYEKLSSLLTKNFWKDPERDPSPLLFFPFWVGTELVLLGKMAIGPKKSENPTPCTTILSWKHRIPSDLRS